MNQIYKKCSSYMGENSFFIERMKRSSPFSMPDVHYHNYYEIYYLLSGKRRYFVENKIFNVNAGDIVFIPKHMLHKTTHCDNYIYTRLLIQFDDNFIPSYMREIMLSCFNKRYYSTSLKISNKIEIILTQIEKEYALNDKFSTINIQGVLFQLFATLLRSNEKIVRINTENIQGVVQKAVDYVCQNSDTVTLYTTAVECGVSREHLSRSFKKYTGFGFQEYVNFVRTMNAKKLLKQTRLSITEIAIQCGFNDSNYFSTVFKKINGITPLIYRKDERID